MGNKTVIEVDEMRLTEIVGLYTREYFPVNEYVGRLVFDWYYERPKVVFGVNYFMALSHYGKIKFTGRKCRDVEYVNIGLVQFRIGWKWILKLFVYDKDVQKIFGIFRISSVVDLANYLQLMDIWLLGFSLEKCCTYELAV